VFTGFRHIVVTHAVWPAGTGDDIGRLNNGSAYNYLVNLEGFFFPFPVRFVPGLR
jgi:hypothetical protein